MKKFVLLSIALLTTAAALYARSLSDSARITLLTCSPGEELYSAFGHTGIRVTDYKNDFDVVFNYGTFDFGQPGFYSNFIKGKMLYMVSTDRFSDFMDEYVYEKRSVTELELNLSPTDKQQIFAFLYNNALPENREYLYDFFWDNCATRPRDVFEKILGNRLAYHTDNAGFKQHATMHDMLRIYVHNRPWINFGFDLILGLPCEIEATPRNQTFLPDYLEKYFECATVDGVPFVIKKATLLNFPPPVINAPVKPIQISLLLVFVGFVIWIVERRNRTHYYRFDFIVYFLAGLLGTFFLGMWLFTAHYSVPKNLNMLWLLPTHLFASFFLLKKQKPLWLKYYFTLTYIVMMLVLIGWNWLPQPLSISAMPLVFLLTARAASIAVDMHFNVKK